MGRKVECSKHYYQLRVSFFYHRTVYTPVTLLYITQLFTVPDYSIILWLQLLNSHSYDVSHLYLKALGVGRNDLHWFASTHDQRILVHLKQLYILLKTHENDKKLYKNCMQLGKFERFFCLLINFEKGGFFLKKQPSLRTLCMYETWHNTDEL